jgi:hypothetical protein
MSINLSKILHDLREKQAREDSRLLPRAELRREPSKSESNAVYHGPGYGLLFCVHGKSNFDVCSACHRTRKDAKAQYEHWCKRYGLSV